MRGLLATFLLVLACQVAVHAAQPRSLEVQVVRILDGDTIEAIDSNKLQHRLRLAGIDAPEKEQGFSDRSRSNLAALVHNKFVQMEWTKTDQYGRFVAKVIVQDRSGCAEASCEGTYTDVNLEQIRAGLAWHYKQYESEQTAKDRREYAAAEDEARKTRVGLWADADPVAPWSWRRGESTGLVKKSRSDICHDPSMTTYPSVKNFETFATLDECIASGGRLPKNLQR